LHRPRALFAGIDFEEAGPVIAARQTVFGAANGELLVARAHEGMAGPFTAAVVIYRVNVIVPCNQRAAQQGIAGPGGDVPPAFGGPAFRILVADGDADAAPGVVADAEVGQRRQRGRDGEQQSGRRSAENGSDKAPGC
jgi:hypothetical protein